jgi:hypothetical protein
MYRLYHAEFNNNQDLQKELRSKLQDQYNGLNVIERGLYSIGLLIQRWVVYPLLGNNEEPLIDQSTATTDPIEEFEEPLIDQSTATTDPIEEDRSAMGKDGIIEVSVPE